MALVIDAVAHTGQRLQHGGAEQIDLVGQMVGVLLLHDGVALKGTVVDIAEAQLANAQVVKAVPAVLAFAAVVIHRLGHDAVAGLKVRDALAHLGHHAGELVADDHGRTGGDGDVAVIDMQVGAADTSILHPDLDLARTGRGFGNLPQLHMTGTVLILHNTFHGKRPP